MDINLEDIPPHRVKPFRFSQRLMGLCFGSSFTLHGAVLVGMVFAHMQIEVPASARSREIPDGDRHVVAVTFSMQMTNFATTPAHTEPSDTQPLDSDGQPANPTTNPDALPPDASEHPIDTPQPNRSDLISIPDPNAATRQLVQALAETPPAMTPPDESLAPSPNLDELFDPLKHIEPRLDASDESIVLLDPLAPELLQQLATVSDQQMKEDSASGEQAAAPSEGETTDIAETDRAAEPAAASEEDAEPPSDDEPREADRDDESRDDRVAEFYDENAVDQPIAFKRKVRPVQSYKSKRFGDTGTIRILVTVDSDGRLLDYKVIDDADQPRLLAAAIKALEASTFAPAILEGKPVRSTWGIEYRF
ncbi:MAG: energy transducer TonB [Phycisphaeraceae bacterium]